MAGIFKEHERHIPVMLGDVLDEFEKVSKRLSSLVAIDCTLGQAGHSIEIFKNLKRGVLLSIDKSKCSIDWVSRYYCFTEKQLVQDNKVWEIIHDDFANLSEILESRGLKYFDFLIADLGFSNLQLQQNIGISYSNQSQKLDMRYGDEGIDAATFLNTVTKSELEQILLNCVQMQKSLVGPVAQAIVTFRQKRKFVYVKDLVNAIGKFGDRVKMKVFHGIRVHINQEITKLYKLLEVIKQRQSELGLSLIISFNSIEEQVITSCLGVHEIREPNITEIVSNVQARSAKLHIYKKQIS